MNFEFKAPIVLTKTSFKETKKTKEIKVKETVKVPFIFDIPSEARKRLSSVKSFPNKTYEAYIKTNISILEEYIVNCNYGEKLTMILEDYDFDYVKIYKNRFTIVFEHNEDSLRTINVHGTFVSDYRRKYIIQYEDERDGELVTENLFEVDTVRKTLKI